MVSLHRRNTNYFQSSRYWSPYLLEVPISLSITPIFKFVMFFCTFSRAKVHCTLDTCRGPGEATSASTVSRSQYNRSLDQALSSITRSDASVNEYERECGLLTAHYKSVSGLIVHTPTPAHESITSFAQVR